MEYVQRIVIILNVLFVVKIIFNVKFVRKGLESIIRSLVSIIVICAKI